MEEQIKVKVKGFKQPLTVIVTDHGDVRLATVLRPREGYTDGTSWNRNRTLTNTEVARAHILWLGQELGS